MTTETQSFDILRDAFQKKGFAHVQLDSFNHMINFSLQGVVDNEPEFQVETKDGLVFRVAFKELTVDKPYVIEENRSVSYISPNEARLRDLTYSAPICIDVETTLIRHAGTAAETVLESQYFNHVPIGRLPIMVRSCKCALANLTEAQRVALKECPYDQGGYFIIKGKEKSVDAQVRDNHNRVYVYAYPPKSKYVHTAKIRSMSDETKHSVLLQVKILKCDRSIVFSVPYLSKDVPVGLILKAMDFDAPAFFGRSGDATLDYFVDNICTDFAALSTEEALVAVGGLVVNPPAGRDKKTAAQQVVHHQLFPHLGLTSNNTERAQFICMMVDKLLRVYLGRRAVDEKDNLANKRIDTTGILVTELFQHLWKRFIRNLETKIDGRRDVIAAMTKSISITQGFLYCFNKGDWGVQKNAFMKIGVCQQLSRTTLSATIAGVRKIVFQQGREGKNIAIRQIHGSSAFFKCPSETPEGHQIGIVCNFAMMPCVSNRVSTCELRDLVMETIGPPSSVFGCIKVFLNGFWLGVARCDTYDALLRLRNLELLPHTTSISRDEIDQEILIFSDEGRMLRPVFTLNDQQQLRITANDDTDWDRLVQTGKIVHLDAHEAESSVVAMTPDELGHNYRYTHCEIHPSMMFGAGAHTIPYCDHTQAPRNLYASSMCKQALGVYALSNEFRADTSNVYLLNYPQRPVVSTVYADSLGYNDMPCGVNAVIAIACYGGWNMEDAIIVNQGALDRGMWRTTCFRTIVTEEKRGGQISETLCVPRTHLRKKLFNYSKLDHDGLPRVGAYISENDVIIGKVLSDVSRVRDQRFVDVSVLAKAGETGYVDKVIVTISPRGYRLIKVKLRNSQSLEIGDKLASRHGQKSTVGMTYRDEDMPFFGDGMRVDAILNPHAIPSRMTINYLLEGVASTDGAKTGRFHDGTAFTRDSKKIRDEFVQGLEAAGLQKSNKTSRRGYETLYNGMTGEPFQCEIFVGSIFMQKLRHMVNDKIHVRDRGNVQTLTRQPTAGRKSDGGLKIGEMERDCLLGQGSSRVLNDAMFDKSDHFQVRLCKECGEISQTNEGCSSCGASEVQETNLPYTMKLLSHMLQAMCLKTQMIPTE